MAELVGTGPGPTVASVAEAVDGAVVLPAGVDPRSIAVTAITHDSRRVTAGGMFCCVTGAAHDGHDYATAAVAAGAVALLVERELPGLGVPQVVVPDVRAALGAASAEVFGHPAREIAVVGVTGTNGKTTTVSLIAQILDATGRPTEVIGTLTGARTTPEATDLQAQLRAAVTAGRSAVAVEVSSHALALGRVDAVEFAVAVFTNLGIDHLDFHGTPERYFDAKARLFELGRANVAVLNVDDVHGRLLRDAASPAGPLVIETSVDGLTDLRLGPEGATFTWRGQVVQVPLLGRHNVANALTAAEAVVALGVDPGRVAASLAGVVAPPGRFETVDMGQPFAVVVDYAHTPDGLEQLLLAVRELTAGRVIAVFGAGGDRDASKRPQMGEVVARLADLVVLTSDNPRSEDPSTIMAAVRSGIDGVADAELHSDIDRGAAIRWALGSARAGDAVVIAGKGHETTQSIGDRVVPFDDRVVARAELVALGFEGRP